MLASDRLIPRTAFAAWLALTPDALFCRQGVHSTSDCPLARFLQATGYDAASVGRSQFTLDRHAPATWFNLSDWQARFVAEFDRARSAGLPRPPDEWAGTGAVASSVLAAL